ncbi:MAG: hypothetical protein WC058_15315 [Phycisphaeraceae bacterium]
MPVFAGGFFVIVIVRVIDGAMRGFEDEDDPADQTQRRVFAGSQRQPKPNPPPPTFP